MDGEWRLLIDEGKHRESPWMLRAVNEEGPPWILHSEWGGEGLWRLSYEPSFQNPKLDPIPVDVVVVDALELDEHRILVVEEDGKLLVFETDRSVLTPWPGPVPDGRVEHVARDGLGRVWLGGDSIWLLDPDAKRLHSLAALPIVANPVEALTADPDHRDGVVLATRGNEVAFIRGSVAR